MPVSQLPQAPYRQDRKNLVTPIVGDVLFSEIRDCTRTPLSEYGTPHPNERKWPHHKLVFIKPVDIERNEIFEFFYAADRENQDLYNFEFSNKTITGVAGRKLRTVERSYVTLREDFDANTPAFNTVMPNIPADQFDTIYYFYEKEQARIPEKELDSLYVVEKHSYVDENLLIKPVSLSTEKGDLTPAKFRYSLPTTTEDKVVEGDVEQPVLTGNELASTEEQLNSFTKEVRTVTRTEQTGNITFTGTRTYVEGTGATSSETLSLTEPAIDSGLFTVESQVTALGDGRFVKETVAVDSWPTLVNAEWDHSIRAQVKTQTTFVAPDDASLQDDYVTYKAINEDRTLRAEEIEPYDELDEYFLGLPTRTDLKLPNILDGVFYDYNNATSIGSGSTNSYQNHYGESYAFNKRQRSETSGTISHKVNAGYAISQPWGSDISAMVYYFYIKNTPENVLTEFDILNRISGFLGDQDIFGWPVFETQSYTITTFGGTRTTRIINDNSHGESYSPKSQSIENSSSVDVDASVQMMSETITIPPCLYSSSVIVGSNSNLIEEKVADLITNVYSTTPRYRFSNDFDANAGDVITLYPSQHQFICDTNITNATIFTSNADGVHTREPLSSSAPSTADTKVYIGGVYGDVVNGEHSIGVNIDYGDTLSGVTNDVIVLQPSGVSFLVKNDFTLNGIYSYPETNFSNRIDILSFLNGSSINLSDTVISKNPVYYVAGDVSSLLADGNSVTFCDSAGTGGSQHTVIVKGIATYDGTSYSNFYVKTYDYATTPTGSDTHFKINGGSVNAYSFYARNLTTKSVNEIREQKPISSQYLELNYWITNTITDGTNRHSLEASVTNSLDKATAIANIHTGEDEIGDVYDVLITYAGIGYTAVPHVEFSAPPSGGTVALAHAVLTGTTVTDIIIDNAGSGYVTPPTVYIDPPATKYTDIPRTGLYMVESRIEPYKWNWLKCMAIVVDMNQFAR